MIAFDLKDYKNKDAGSMRDEMRNIMKDNGLFVLATGDKGIRFRPHLDITRDEIDTGIQLLDKSFNDLSNK
jgi:L-lysine 6-transaminase